MKKYLPFLLLFLTSISNLRAQDVFWFEDFDNGAAARWTLTGNDPTPAGITGLTYGVNGAVTHDYFMINDANTPELNGSIVVGQSMSDQGQFVRGHHYDCSSPSNLPNPFVNTGATNNSLHITAYAGCSGLIYAGTPGYDDWNCLTISGNDAPLTQTEQIAVYNSNIDATGKCNIKLTADFFLGGSANGLEAHSTVLYSIDGGATWKIVQDNIAPCSHFIAGSCNNWNRRSFELPADADNQPDLRIAFRWYEDANTNNNTQDYALGGSFNVDNVMLSSCSKPNTNFRALNGTSYCKNQTIEFESLISTTPGVYMNCFSVLTDNCTISGYTWSITGPGSVTYVDGTSSTDANPHVQLGANGTYNVSLTASTCGGDSTITKVSYITIADCPPAANFSASNTAACADPASKLDTISFTDLSTTFSAPITAWAWTFNPATVTYVGGTSSTDANPQVTFNATGSYEVSLQVTTSEGIDTETKTALIEVISCQCGGAAGGPANLYFDDFEGAPTGWTLNTANESGSANTATTNTWIINNSYTSAFGNNTDQAALPAPPHNGGVKSNYLHIHASGLSTNNTFSAGTSEWAFVRSPIINATGATGLTLSFWLQKGSPTGQLYYSVNGGTSWTLKNSYAATAGGGWAYKTETDAAWDNQANLRFGFKFTDAGSSDPALGIDDVSLDAASATSSPNTWIGTTNDWGTASNWTYGTVPTDLENVLIPSAADLVGTFMPTISAAAFALNVCNFGVITLTGNNTLSIDGDLLNEGVVTTDNSTATSDVIFRDFASFYRGEGTMYDVDVEVLSSDFTLENNLSTRSLRISTAGTVDIATFDLSLNKNLTKTAGTFTCINGKINFIDACGSCVDQTNTADVTLNANQTFGNVTVNKPSGVKTSLMSAVNHTINSPKSLVILAGILDVNTNTLNGNGNLIMTGGELQIAKCGPTVVPEMTGAYNLFGGQVTFDGVCDQVTRVTTTASPTTVFSETFESPAIANGANIVGNIAGWTETATNPHATARFINNEGAGLTVQTGAISVNLNDGNTNPVTETLTSQVIDFGSNTTNPTLTYDYSIGATGEGTQLEVLYKSAPGDPWTVGATHNTLNSSATGQTLVMAGASSTFYIGFRVTVTSKPGNPGKFNVIGSAAVDNLVVTGEGVNYVYYYDLEYTGTNIKTLDNDNLFIKNDFLLNLPTTLGNYANTNLDTINVLNSNPAAVVHTGGHVVGFLNRAIVTGNDYVYHIGSENGQGDTYFEPATVSPNSMSGVSSITGKFYDSIPQPDTVANIEFITGIGTTDTIKTVETEGYWHFNPDATPTGGNYTVTVSPDVRYWTFTKTWGGGFYALLKQDSLTYPWDFVNGGIRQDDSTTLSYVDFSNYALGYADSIIPVLALATEIVTFEGRPTAYGNLLSWQVLINGKTNYFEVEKSEDGVTFEHLGVVSGQDYDENGYRITDPDPFSETFYRLKLVQSDDKVRLSNVIVIDNKFTGRLAIYPNPAQDRIYITSKNGVTLTNIKIYNNLGEVVKEQDSGSGIMDIADLPSGAYIVKVRTDSDQMLLEKLIVH